MGLSDQRFEIVAQHRFAAGEAALHTACGTRFAQNAQPFVVAVWPQWHLATAQTL
jgi:hypothetical protein